MTFYTVGPVRLHINGVYIGTVNMPWPVQTVYQTSASSPPDDPCKVENTVDIPGTECKLVRRDEQ